jgi:small GTP-binding protein
MRAAHNKTLSCLFATRFSRCFSSSKTRGPRADTVYYPLPDAALNGVDGAGDASIADSPPVKHQRSLSVALVGEPNAGKSSLLNALVRAPLSAVSKKYNTTRAELVGVVTEGRAQLTLTDTPGLVPPDDSGRYQRTLVRAAHAAAKTADVVLLVVDIARRLGPAALQEMDAMVRAAAASGAVILVAANKADLIRGAPLSAEQASIVQRSREGNRRAGGAEDVLSLKVALLQEWLEAAATRAGIIGAGGFDAPFMWVQAREGRAPPDSPESRAADEGAASDWPASRYNERGQLLLRAPSVYRHARLPPVATVSAGGDATGVDDLRAALLRLAPHKPWQHAAGVLTNRSDVDTIADVVRGRIFDVLHAEVPYTVRQSTRSWREVVVDAAGQMRDAVPQERDVVAAAAPLSRAPIKPADDWVAAWQDLAGETSSQDLLIGNKTAQLSLRRAVVIHQDIQVPSARVAAMLLARGGAHVASIARGAAADASRILGRKVLLQLHVSVVGRARGREELS